LGLMEFLPAYRLWVLVMVLVMVGSMAAVAVELRMRAATVGPVVVAVLLSSPMIGTLGLGQIYPLLTAGLVAAWLADRRGRLVFVGLALGLVVALKPSLAPVLLVPALRRRWLTVGAALLAGTGATVLGWIVCGPDSAPTWAQLLLTNPPVTYWDNASLPGAILRLTSVNDWGRPLVELPGGMVIGLLIGGVLLVSTAWAARRPPADGLDTALWAMAAAALLASPLSWHNYLLVLMPGVVVLIACGRWPVAALLLALSLIGMEWPPIWYGDDNTVPALPVSLYCAILLTYWFALLPRPRPCLGRPNNRLNSGNASAPAPETAIA
ncbi:MAG TPA: glycosyltransferase family 87 protein, partial [Pseudonocardia sp.]